jgi:hypothetical protein
MALKILRNLDASDFGKFPIENAQFICKATFIWVNSTVLLSLPAPGHLHAHRNVILDRHQQKFWRVNFEVRHFRRNCAR